MRFMVSTNDTLHAHKHIHIYTEHTLHQPMSKLQNMHWIWLFSRGIRFLFAFCMLWIVNLSEMNRYFIYVFNMYFSLANLLFVSFLCCRWRWWWWVNAFRQCYLQSSKYCIDGQTDDELWSPIAISHSSIAVEICDGMHKHMQKRIKSKMQFHLMEKEKPTIEWRNKMMIRTYELDEF